MDSGLPGIRAEGPAFLAFSSSKVTGILGRPITMLPPGAMTFKSPPRSVLSWLNAKSNFPS